jgi:hypothetical protein
VPLHVVRQLAQDAGSARRRSTSRRFSRATRSRTLEEPSPVRHLPGRGSAPPTRCWRSSPRRLIPPTLLIILVVVDRRAGDQGDCACGAPVRPPLSQGRGKASPGCAQRAPLGDTATHRLRTRSPDAHRDDRRRAAQRRQFRAHLGDRHRSRCSMSWAINLIGPLIAGAGIAGVAFGFGRRTSSRISCRACS